MKHIWKVLPLLLCVALLFALTACNVNNTPPPASNTTPAGSTLTPEEQELANAASGTVDDLAASWNIMGNNVTDVWKDAIQGGSIAIHFTPDPKKPTEALDAKLFFSDKALAYDLIFPNGEGGRIPMQLFATDEEIAIRYISENLYGVKYSDIAAKFDTSIFNDPTNKFYISTDAWVNVGASAGDLTEMPSFVSEETLQALEAWLLTLPDMLRKEIPTVVETKNGVSDYSWTASAQAVVNIVKSVTDSALADSELSDLLYELYQMSGEGTKSKELFLLDVKHEIAESLREMESEADQSTVTLAMQVKDGKLAKISLTGKEEDGTFQHLFTVLLSGSEFKVILTDGTDYKGNTVYLILDMGAMEEDGKKVFSIAFGEATVKVGTTMDPAAITPENPEGFRLSYDPANGCFEAMMILNEPSYSAVGITATILVADNTCTVSDLALIASGTDGSTTTESLDLSVTIKTKDTMPQIPAYTDLLTVTTEQMEAIVDEWGIGDLFEEDDFVWVWGDDYTPDVDFDVDFDVDVDYDPDFNYDPDFDYNYDPDFDYNDDPDFDYNDDYDPDYDYSEEDEQDTLLG